MTLVKLKRYPTLRRHLFGKLVRIWSGEHMAWWRANASGYTTVKSAAGVYTFEDAWMASSHCDKSKKIDYQVAQPEYEI